MCHRCHQQQKQNRQQKMKALHERYSELKEKVEKKLEMHSKNADSIEQRNRQVVRVGQVRRLRALVEEQEAKIGKVTQQNWEMNRLIA